MTLLTKVRFEEALNKGTGIFTELIIGNCNKDACLVTTRFDYAYINMNGQYNCISTSNSASKRGITFLISCHFHLNR